MQIWVDADALPNAIKDLLIRAAIRLDIRATFVANQPMRLKKSSLIHFLLVKPGLDVADEEIARRTSFGDLVITADIPLAADVVGRGAFVLTPRGDFLTVDNVQERLSVRNFMHDLRLAGVETGGPSTFTTRDQQNFANALDKFLTQFYRTDSKIDRGNHG